MTIEGQRIMNEMDNELEILDLKITDRIEKLKKMITELEVIQNKELGDFYKRPVTDKYFLKMRKRGALKNVLIQTAKIK
jgi:hypothetical protein